MALIRWQGCRPAVLACVASIALAHTAVAETAIVAVATNFAEAAEDISRDFEAETSHRIRLSLGATGKLYAQIKSGAPYDAFLAADQDRPKKLIIEGFAVSDSLFTYATGQLTLWSADPGRITSGGSKTLLASTSVRSIAIANPALAPYGLAAQQVLEKLRLWSSIKPRIVMGENIGQTFALVATGNAALGFVARSQLNSKRGKAIGGSRWDVPANLHAPINQDAVLLKRGNSNLAAKTFLDYLKSSKARAILSRLGYKVPKQ